MSSYRAAVAQLYELGHELAKTPSAKFDLGHMRVLLEALGHPECAFPAVLIAGTNGKGSTASTLASILQAAGHRTGLYTSPHLLRINQRIRVNGEEISDAAFAPLHDRVERAAAPLVAAGRLPWHPSFFEMLTAMAFAHFAAAGVDIAVLEVGMGGRLDATNVVDPVLSVITDISLDHQKYLGNTITEIAGEKAGIIRPGGVVVTLPQHPEASEVIGKTILERQARLVSAEHYVPPVSAEAQRDCVARSADEHVESARNRYSLEVMGRQILVDSPLLGRHQLRNIALAIAAAEELARQETRRWLTISPGDIERGIRQTHWPGRFEVVPASGGRPELVLDVAHNPAGAWALRAALAERYPQSGAAGAKQRPLIFVFGIMRDKPVAEIAGILFPRAQQVLATQARNPRAATPEEICAAAAGIRADIVSESAVAAAVERACVLAGADGVVVVTGSIYVVGEALCALESRRHAQPV